MSQRNPHQPMPACQPTSLPAYQPVLLPPYPGTGMDTPMQRPPSWLKPPKVATRVEQTLSFLLLYYKSAFPPFHIGDFSLLFWFHSVNKSFSTSSFGHLHIHSFLLSLETLWESLFHSLTFTRILSVSSTSIGLTQQQLFYHPVSNTQVLRCISPFDCQWEEIVCIWTTRHKASRLPFVAISLPYSPLPI